MASRGPLTVLEAAKDFSQLESFHLLGSSDVRILHHLRARAPRLRHLLMSAGEEQVKLSERGTGQEEREAVRAVLQSCPKLEMFETDCAPFTAELFQGLHCPNIRAFACTNCWLPQQPARRLRRSSSSDWGSVGSIDDDDSPGQAAEIGREDEDEDEEDEDPNQFSEEKKEEEELRKVSDEALAAMTECFANLTELRLGAYSQQRVTYSMHQFDWSDAFSQEALNMLEEKRHLRILDISHLDPPWGHWRDLRCCLSSWWDALFPLTRDQHGKLRRPLIRPKDAAARDNTAPDLYEGRY